MLWSGLEKVSAMNVSVVVPVYNSEASLPELVQRLESILKSVADEFELILVNDGSSDQSWHAVQDLASRQEWVRGIDLMRNYGQHNALLCGIRAARYEVIVTMDDDLQHPPEEVPLLLRELEEGFDVIYGAPQERKHRFWRNILSFFLKVVLRFSMGIKIAGSTSAFRAFRSEVREAFADFNNPYVSIDVLLSWGTTRFGSVPVRHEDRASGASNYTLSKLFSLAFNIITGYSVLPLRLASLLGMFFTLFGLGVFCYILGRYFIEGGSVPGFPFLGSVIAIFFGALFFVIGIIGEYLARIHFRTMEKPPYVVRSRADESPDRNTTGAT